MEVCCVGAGEFRAYIDVRLAMQLQSFRRILGGTVTKLRGCALCLLLLLAMPLPAQSPGLSEMYALIRAEETNNSKIMWIIHKVADVYTPPLTATPNLKAADDWAVKTMTSWGLANAHLEPWTFQPSSAATPVPAL